MYRVGEDIYLRALLYVVKDPREHLCEFRLGPSGALHQEVMVVSSRSDHALNGANVRPYRFDRVTP